MATQLDVSPGAVVDGTNELDSDLLNAIANPVVTIPDGALPADAIDGDDFVSKYGDAFRSLNYLPQGAFHWDDFQSGVLACPVGVRTSPVIGWYVQPSGAAVTAERSTDTPDNRSGHSLKVTGASGVTLVEIGSYLSPSVTGLAQGTVVWSCWLYNGTGTAFIPGLQVVTSAVEGDEGNLNSQAFATGSTSCPNAAWTRVSFTISTAVVSAAAWKRGAHVSLLIPADGGVMDSVADFVEIAQAEISKLALSPNWTPIVTDESPFPPGMLMPWPGDAVTIPAGWLLCNGGAIPRGQYRGLFDRIGVKYGSGDGVSTFNLPDLRGGIPVGAEASGAVQGRMEIEAAGCGLTNGSAYVTVTSAANLRRGMGAFHASLPAGTTIESIVSATLVKLTANATATAGPVTVRFSKLGPADAEVIGVSGPGMVQSERKIEIRMTNVSTGSNTTLSVPGLGGLACGMLVDCAGVPAGTTIAAFLTANTVRLSAAATATASGLTATFRVDAPEGEQAVAYQNLLRNPTVMCTISSSSDSNLQAVPGNFLLGVGWSVSGHAVIQAGCLVTQLDSGGIDFNIAPATSGASPGSVELTFTGGSTFPCAGTSILPRMVVMHWMIKA